MKKILLDENLPHPLANKFSSECEVKTVSEIGWAKKKNGELLDEMQKEGFDVLLTVDKNLRYQQNLDKYNMKIVVLRTYDNRYKTLVPHIPMTEQKITEIPVDTKVIEIDLR